MGTRLPSSARGTAPRECLTARRGRLPQGLGSSTPFPGHQRGDVVPARPRVLLGIKHGRFCNSRSALQLAGSRLSVKSGPLIKAPSGRMKKQDTFGGQSSVPVGHGSTTKTAVNGHTRTKLPAPVLPGVPRWDPARAKTSTAALQRTAVQRVSPSCPSLAMLLSGHPPPHAGRTGCSVAWGVPSLHRGR